MKDRSGHIEGRVLNFPERIVEALSSASLVLKKASGLEIQGRLVWRSFGHLVPLVVGEVLSGLCNFSVVVFISRYFGVTVLGFYALAQTVAGYVVLGMDLGLKTMGARVIAMNPAHALPVVQRIQRKRIFLAAFFVPLALCYAFWGPIPSEARLLVALFALSAAPYAVAIDWVLWGMERFLLLGAWRATVGALFVALVVSSVFFAHTDINAVVFANGFSVGMGALCLWGFWRLRLRGDIEAVSAGAVEYVRRELSWQNTGSLGLAVILNQIFQTVNILLLGALSTPVQVGLYNASYKLIFMMLLLFYLATQAIFPSLAKLTDSVSARKRIIGLAGVVFVSGAGIILPAQFLSGKIIQLLYGEQFAESAQLLRILLLAVPFSFSFFFLGTVLTAWGMFRRALAVTAAATLASVALNLYLIPYFGALGAAWAMVISCCVYNGAALIAFNVDRGL